MRPLNCTLLCDHLGVSLPAGRVAFVITDVEGSTGLLRRLGDRWSPLLAAHHQILRRSFTSSGGTVFKSTGDGVMAAFSDPRAAIVSCARAQRELAAHPWPVDGEVHVRMAVHVGQGQPVDGDYVSYALHQAARLCPLGHGEQVLLSEAVVAAIGELRTDLSLVDLGAHRVRDFDDPVRIFQLTGPGLRRDFPALRAAREAAWEVAPLLEREGDLATLTEALEALSTKRRGGVFLVEGPPGIGKSALLEAALASEAVTGLSVLRAHGTELAAVLAFGGARQLFTQPVMALEETERDALLVGPARLARPVLGVEASGSAPIGDPVYGLFWLAVALSERRPLVIAVDDLHWLDEESGRFVAYLGERGQGSAILLLATARVPEPGTPSGPWSALARYGAVVRPEPLSNRAVARMITHPSVETVHRVTGGNPLFVQELARALATAPAASVEELGTASIAKLVLDRVRRVGPTAVTLAHAVALFPDGASMADAAAVGRLDDDDAADAADALIEAHVFADAERLQFLHPVMRSSVYDDLSRLARTRGHGRAIAMLRGRGAPADMVAAHLLAIAPTGDPEDVRVLLDAADEAERRQAPAAAARYVERALAERPDPRLRGRLGRLRATSGDRRAAKTLRAAMDELDDPVERVDAAIAYGKVAMQIDPAWAHAELSALRATIEVDPQRALALDALIAQGALNRHDFDYAEFEAVLSRIPPNITGDTPHERHALSMLAALAALRADPVEIVRDLTLRSIPSASETEDDFGGDATDSIDFLTMTGDLELAKTLAQERMDRARERGADAPFTSAQLVLSYASLQAGDLMAAEGDGRLALAAARTPREEVIAASRLAAVLVKRGELDEVARLLDRLPPEALPARPVLRGQLSAARGDVVDAAAAFAEALAYHRRGAGSLVWHVLWVDEYVEALAALGRGAEARELARELLHDAERFGETRCLARAHRALGTALTGDEARAHFKRAHALLDGSPFRYDTAQVRVHLAACLRRAGDLGTARELLEMAFDYAEREGARLLKARIREELALIGAPAPAADRGSAPALPPAQMQIAQLVAQGMSSTAIAQHLFLTVEAVEAYQGHGQGH